MEERSYLKIRKEDLAHLAKVARGVLNGLFERRPELGAIYAEKLFALVLAQGAALHYVDGVTGIKILMSGPFSIFSRAAFPTEMAVYS